MRLLQHSPAFSGVFLRAQLPAEPPVFPPEALITSLSHLSTTGTFLPLLSPASASGLRGRPFQVLPQGLACKEATSRGCALAACPAPEKQAQHLAAQLGRAQKPFPAAFSPTAI